MTPSFKSASQDGENSGTSIDWQTVLPEYDRWLRTVVYSRLRDVDATNDVMQEVALAAVRQAAPLHDADRVAPWLYRLAVRQVLLFRRQKGRQRRLADRYARQQVWHETKGISPDPLQWLLADERRELVRATLERLPTRELEILLLKYTENWSYHDIARRLGISASAVESRLHRARQRMRAALSELRVTETTP